MKVIKDIELVKYCCREEKLKGKQIGFVPTLGCLHKGHLSLIQKARKMCDFVVVSIFVNPTQFDSSQDFKMYPKDLSKDIQLCEREGVDVAFAPSKDEMYPEGFSTWVEVKGKLTSLLEGAFRPHHFTGVTTIVAKLFNIVFPDVSFFGEKDYQQALVIKKMVKELHMDTKIMLLPTIREEDGLACSSRNKYLNPQEKKAATVLYKSLLTAKEVIHKGQKDPSGIKTSMRELINKEPLVKVDYIEIVNPRSLESVEEVKGKVFVTLAARVGKARLIDNMIV